MRSFTIISIISILNFIRRIIQIKTNKKKSERKRLCVDLHMHYLENFYNTFYQFHVVFEIIAYFTIDKAGSVRDFKIN